MHIGLDYDHTYTADPKLWDDFIVLCLDAKHKVSIVTFRDDRYDKTPALERLRHVMFLDVVYTRGFAKKAWMLTHHSAVDVWIDDRPEGILQNSSLTPDQLAEWRAADQAERGIEIERPAA